MCAAGGARTPPPTWVQVVLALDLQELVLQVLQQLLLELLAAWQARQGYAANA